MNYLKINYYSKRLFNEKLVRYDFIYFIYEKQSAVFNNSIGKNFGDEISSINYSNFLLSHFF